MTRRIARMSPRTAEPLPRLIEHRYDLCGMIVLAIAIVAVSGPAVLGLLAAQSAPPPSKSQATLSFEVVSVKQNKRFGWIRRPWAPNMECPGDRCAIHGNRFSEEAVSLMDVVMDAYAIRHYQIAGLPSWGDTGKDVYDISAKIEGERTPTVPEVRLMLQTLLTDRFQLKVHHETRELPFYALVPAKNGSKLTKAESCQFMGSGGRNGGIGGGGGSISPLDDPAFKSLVDWQQIPDLLSMYTDRPVIDKTGFVEGVYCTEDGQYAFLALDTRGLSTASGRGGAPLGRSPDGDFPPASIYRQVQDKWGLRLDPQKGPVDMVVIDHVERPSEN